MRQGRKKRSQRRKKERVARERSRDGDNETRSRPKIHIHTLVVARGSPSIAPFASPRTYESLGRKERKAFRAWRPEKLARHGEPRHRGNGGSGSFVEIRINLRLIEPSELDPQSPGDARNAPADSRESRGMNFEVNEHALFRE